MQDPPPPHFAVFLKIEQVKLYVDKVFKIWTKFISTCTLLHTPPPKKGGCMNKQL